VKERPIDWDIEIRPVPEGKPAQSMRLPDGRALFRDADGHLQVTIRAASEADYGEAIRQYIELTASLPKRLLGTAQVSISTFAGKPVEWSGPFHSLLERLVGEYLAHLNERAWPQKDADEAEVNERLLDLEQQLGWYGRTAKLTDAEQRAFHILQHGLERRLAEAGLRW